MEFRPVRLEDKAAIEHFTRPSGICNCDLAFANMYCWEGTYRSAWCVEEGFLLIRFYIDGSHHIGYMQPLGEGDFTHLIPRLEADARAAGQPLRISGLTPEGAAAVRRAHPEFGIWRNRDYEDYVYRADDLRNLTGRRYQPKRNHINRFEAAYDYRYEELTPALAPECMRLEREWRAGHDSHAAELTAEQRAMQRAFNHFGELELRGGALFVREKLVAFTIGSAINDEAFCIHVEKADTRYDGAFTMINRLFAQHLPPHYTLIDREEDLGLEGLRQSKLSYHPLFLQPKLTAQRLTEEQLQLRALWLACFPEDTQDDVEQFLLSRYDERRCLADAATARRRIHHHVLDPRLAPRRDVVKGHAEQPDDPAVLRCGDQLTGRRRGDDPCDSLPVGCRHPFRQLRQQPRKGLRQQVGGFGRFVNPYHKLVRFPPQDTKIGRTFRQVRPIRSAHAG